MLSRSVRTRVATLNSVATTHLRHRFNFSVGQGAQLGDKIYVGIRGGVTLHTHSTHAATLLPRGAGAD